MLTDVLLGLVYLATLVLGLEILLSLFVWLLTETDAKIQQAQQDDTKSRAYYGTTKSNKLFERKQYESN